MQEEDLLGLVCKHRRVNRREQVYLSNELRLSYQPEVTDDGSLLSTKWHAGRTARCCFS